MRHTAHPPGREEPRLDDYSPEDAEIVDYADQRVVVTPPPRSGWLRRLGRGLRNLLLVLLLIVGLSYLPDAWLQQQHAHVQDAVRICGDIRDLLQRIGLDLWHWLQSAVPRWYGQLHALLPASLSDHLPAPSAVN